VADAVNPTKDGNEGARPDPVHDLMARDPCPQQLRSGNDAMRAGGQAGNFFLSSGRFVGHWPYKSAMVRFRPSDKGPY
jgi:hypothetical protein